MIGLNDAERIAPCDITIFHDAWVNDALRSNGYRSRAYISPIRPQPGAKGKWLWADYVPGSQEGTDVMMGRLVSSEPEKDFVVEDVLFLSALRLARLIAKQRGRRQTVYMLGFDFSAEKGYAHAVSHDFSAAESGARSAKIAPQEHYFINSLYMLGNGELDIKHVGYRAFSALTPSDLDALFLPDRTGGKDAANRVLITAELTTNHFGDRYRLERMVRSAKAAGADFVKVQKRDPESFYSQEQLASRYVSPFGDTFREYRHALELNHDDFVFLDTLCRDLGIRWFASVLDKPSYEFIQQFNPELIKLPSTISEHTDYLSHVAATHRGGVVLSTGMTNKDFEKWVLEKFKNCDELYLLQCNSAYPTPPHDCDVGVVRHYRDLAREHSKIIPGYSSHDFGWMASVIAVGAGARMLEKHVKLGNTEWAHFDAVAMDLTTSEFIDYVAKVREAEMIVGSEEKKINGSEHHKYFRTKG